jgi:hypothetical protein
VQGWQGARGAQSRAGGNFLSKRAEHMFS